MNLQQLISFLFERGNAMQTFWGFYITVSLGLIAFFGASKRPPHLTALVSLVFIAFATVNASGMLDIAKQREFLWSQLNSYSAPGSSTTSNPSDVAIAAGIKQVARPPTFAEVKRFHIGCDIAILIAIWVLTLWPRNKETQKPDGRES
jgi:hypothetical protein